MVPVSTGSLPSALDDSYAWPNLFQEADEMLLVSLLVYPFTKLRQLARDGSVSAQNILDLPITALQAIEAVEQNATALKEQMGDEDVNMCRAALQSLHERYEMTEEGVEISYQSAELVAYGDEKSEEELVYAIGIDRRRKRVTVAFRGSVTQKDFMTDASIAMRDMMNPLASFPDQEDMVKIHSGFYHYLLEKKSEETKFTEIAGHLKPLLELHPDYKLYVTGHSLGGALACLFAFQIASSSELQLPKPVTCVSVASPKVGNEGFRKAFQLLEEEGLLRHLRIVNDMDPVTLLPPVSSKLLLASLSPAALIMSSMSKKNTVTDEVYKHVGIRLKLLKGGNYKLRYSNGHWRQDFFNPKAATSVSHHYGYEYSSRMLHLREALEKMFLNDLYKMKESL
jgi:predicted lipase